MIEWREPGDPRGAERLMVTLTGTRAVPDWAWVRAMLRMLDRGLERLMEYGDATDRRVAALESRIDQIEEALAELESEQRDG